MIRPLLEISRLEQGLDESQETIVVEVFTQDRDQGRMIQIIEALSDIALDEPGCTFPGVVDLREGSVAPSGSTKSVGMDTELGFIVRFQNESDNLLQQFVRPTRKPERASLRRVLLLDIDASDWRPAIAFSTEACDDRIDFRQGHAIHRFGGASRRHCAMVAVDPAIRLEVQVTIEQESIDTFHRQSSSATFADDTQNSCGVSHLAYLSILRIRNTCHPSPGTRLSRAQTTMVAPSP